MYQKLFIDGLQEYVQKQADKTLNLIDQNQRDHDTKMAEIIHARSLQKFRELNCPDNQENVKKPMVLSDNLKANEKKLLKTEANFEVKSGQNSDRLEPPITENLNSYRNNGKTKDIEMVDQRVNAFNHHEIAQNSMRSPHIYQQIENPADFMDVHTNFQQILEQDTKSQNLNHMRLFLVRCISHFSQKLCQIERQQNQSKSSTNIPPSKGSKIIQNSPAKLMGDGYQVIQNVYGQKTTGSSHEKIEKLNSHLSSQSKQISAKSTKMVEEYLNPMIRLYLDMLKEQTFVRNYIRMEIDKNGLRQQSQQMIPSQFIERQGGQGKQTNPVNLNSVQAVISHHQKTFKPLKSSGNLVNPVMVEMIKDSSSNKLQSSNMSLNGCSSSEIALAEGMVWAEKINSNAGSDLEEDQQMDQLDINTFSTHQARSHQVDLRVFHPKDAETSRSRLTRSQRNFAQSLSQTQQVDKSSEQAGRQRYSLRRQNGSTVRAAPVEFMQLSKEGKPQCLSLIGDQAEWNFTGRPIQEVLEQRNKTRDLMNRKRSTILNDEVSANVDSERDQTIAERIALKVDPRLRRTMKECTEERVRREMREMKNLIGNYGAKEFQRMNKQLKFAQMEKIQLKEKERTKVIKQPIQVQKLQPQMLENGGTKIGKGATMTIDISKKSRQENLSKALKGPNSIHKNRDKAGKFSKKAEKAVYQVNSSQENKDDVDMENDDSPKSDQENLNTENAQDTPDQNKLEAIQFAKAQESFQKIFEAIQSPTKEQIEHMDQLGMVYIPQQIVPKDKRFRVYKPKRDKQIPLVYTEEEMQLKPYVCEFCPIRFEIPSALGGHISKAHPGKSRAYNHKKTVREARELERSLHRHAMNEYIKIEKKPEILEQIRNDDFGHVNRNTIKKIKKQLVRVNETYEVLKDKYLGSHERDLSVTPNSGDEKKNIEISNDNIIQQEVWGMKDVEKLGFCSPTKGTLIMNQPFDPSNLDENYDLMKHVNDELNNDPIQNLENLDKIKVKNLRSKVKNSENPVKFKTERQDQQKECSSHVSNRQIPPTTCTKISLSQLEEHGQRPIVFTTGKALNKRRRGACFLKELRGNQMMIPQFMNFVQAQDCSANIKNSETELVDEALHLDQLNKSSGQMLDEALMRKAPKMSIKQAQIKFLVQKEKNSVADLVDKLEESEEIEENEDRKIIDSDTVPHVEDPEAQIEPKVEPSKEQ